MQQEKARVIRVAFDTPTHDIFEKYQKAARALKKAAPSKADLVVLAMEKGGLPWIIAETEAMREEARQAI